MKKQNVSGYSFVEAEKIISEYLNQSTSRLRSRLTQSWKKGQVQNKKLVVHA